MVTPGLHNASCHCGGVKFTVNVPEGAYVRRCNCSICAMKGVVMLDVPLSNLAVTEGKELLSLYTFNSHEAKHRFCSRCGIHCFHQTRSEPDKFGINAACIEGVSPCDWTEVPVFDGQNHPKDGGTPRYAGVMRFVPSED